MERYWDIEEGKRADLTEEQISDCCRYELMEQGIIVPAQPEYLTETKPEPSETVRYFCVMIGYHKVLFRTADDAAAFIALKPHTLDSLNYRSDVQVAKPAETSIVPMDVPTMQAAQDMATAAIAYKEAKETNEKLRREYNNAVESAERATQEIWKDWSGRLHYREYLGRIRDTYAQYIDMANGDEVAARRFLEKAYGEADVAEAIGAADAA
jgi:hypothetical protein